jgi:acyl-CoA hydrolase
VAHRLTARQLAGSIARGERLFIAGSAGEPTALLRAWIDDPDLTRGIDVTTSFVPGINQARADHFHATARISSIFPLPGRAPGQRPVTLLPYSYFGVARALAADHPIDTVVVHVTPPDRNGRCSFGPAVEFMPTLLGTPKRILAIFNHALPALAGSFSLPVDAIEAYCETDEALPALAVEDADSGSAAIAAHVACLIGDGAVLQLGIGKIPGALPGLIKDRRNLRFHSGLITDGMELLAAAGALSTSQPSVACALLGRPAFYDWLKERGGLLVRGCDETHHPAHLAAIEGLFAVNSALEVDLLGQVNMEIGGGRRVSAPGGAPDFAFAASHSMTGLSIIALPSSTSKGRSRIVKRLDAGTPVGIPRQCVDVVVTEFGRADLRGLGAEARAEALAAIAHPSARSDLSGPWSDFDTNSLIR